MRRRTPRAGSPDEVEARRSLATPVDVDIKGTNEIAPFATTHGVAGDNSGTPHECITYHGVAANKALECDISGGGGTEKVIGWFVYWYEVI